MQRAMLLACFAWTGIGSIAAAQEAAESPQAPAPTITTVRLSEKGNLEIFDYTTRREARTIIETFDEGGRTREVRRTVVDEVPVFVMRSVGIQGAAVYDLDGNQYEWKDVEKLLAKPTPVILSRGPKKVDPFYRQMFQMGTLVLVLPPEPAADYIAPPAVPSTPRR